MPSPSLLRPYGKPRLALHDWASGSGEVEPRPPGHAFYIVLAYLFWNTSMSVIVLKVVKSLGRWAVMHNEVPVASFDTKEDAERAALAIAKRHPARATGHVDLPAEGGGVSAIHIF